MQIKRWSEKYYVSISLSIVLYFVCLYLIYKFQVRSVFIGVLSEMLTLPLMLAELFFFGFGIHLILKRKAVKMITKGSIVILGISTLLTVASLIIGFF